MLYTYQGKYAQAESLLANALDVETSSAWRDGRDDAPDRQQPRARVLRMMASTRRQSRSTRTSLEIRRRVLGEEHDDTLSSMNNLAMLSPIVRGKYAQATPLQAKVVDVWRRVLGEEHPFTITAVNNLALMYYGVGSVPRRPSHSGSGFSM